MILNEEYQILKPVLGHRYAKAVQADLLANGVVVKEGQTYSKAFISHVLNGRYENPEIEAAIYRLYESRNAILQLQLNRKITLLKNKKPVSGHSQV